jgi:hypothetical protein
MGPTHPPIQRKLRALSSGVNQLDIGAEYSTLSIAEVKNGVAIPPLPHTSSWRGKVRKR